MNRLAWTSLAFVAVLATALPADSQIQPNAECQAAQVWHLQQNLHWTTYDERHAGMAAAAEQLAGFGGAPCQNWKQDAAPMRPNYQTGEWEEVTPP